MPVNIQPLYDKIMEDAAKIKHWHTVDNGWDDIGYHYVIKRDVLVEMPRLDLYGKTK